MVKAGIIGATGYAGNEIVRLLLGHKDVEIKWFGSRSYIDQQYADIYQNFFKLVDAKCMDDNMAALAIVTASLLGGILYSEFGTKKSYDYSEYYVESKPSKTAKDNKDDKGASEKELSLSLLQKTNKDVVGILEFDNRVIYEPVVQAPDNDYYVRKNIKKEYANAGIPFVSADGNIDSKNVVIYGHSSKWNSIIFTPLMSYIDQSCYKEHQTFKFITENETRTYQIFEVMNVDLNNLNDSLEFTQSSWDSDTSFNAFISDSINRGLYKTGISVNTDDKLMTLVTCDTRNDNKRIVILAKSTD